PFGHCREIMMAAAAPHRPDQRQNNQNPYRRTNPEEQQPYAVNRSCAGSSRVQRRLSPGTVAQQNATPGAVPNPCEHQSVPSALGGVPVCLGGMRSVSFSGFLTAM